MDSIYNLLCQYQHTKVYILYIKISISNLNFIIFINILIYIYIIYTIPYSQFGHFLSGEYGFVIGLSSYITTTPATFFDSSNFLIFALFL